MSGQMSLVVRQGALSELEAALTAASDDIARHVEETLDSASRASAGWQQSTASRAAEQDHQARLRAGVQAMTEQLERLRSAVATAREAARQKEIDNVALCD